MTAKFGPESFDSAPYAWQSYSQCCSLGYHRPSDFQPCSQLWTAKSIGEEQNTNTVSSLAWLQEAQPSPFTRSYTILCMTWCTAHTQVPIWLCVVLPAGTMRLRPGGESGTGLAGLLGTIQKTLGTVTKVAGGARKGAKNPTTVRTTVHAY